MNEELQLKLQAYLDGELAEQENQEIEALLARSDAARSLVTELRNTNGALHAFAGDLKLPESREFFWSKVRREIERTEAAAPVREPAVVPSWWRWLMPAGAFAVVAIAGLLALQQFKPASVSPMVETYLADTGAMTYRDEIEKTTLVWLSYPAENDFAQPATPDTIQ